MRTRSASHPPAAAHGLRSGWMCGVLVLLGLTSPGAQAALAEPVDAQRSRMGWGKGAMQVGLGAVAPLEGSRLALEFRAVGNSKAAPPLSSSLLRVQMSETSTLQFRPRSGGLAVTYRAKF